MDKPIEKLSPAVVREQMEWKLEVTDWNFGAPLPLEKVLEASPEGLDSMVRKVERDNKGFDAHRNKLHRTIEALILKGDEASRQRAIEIAAKLVQLNEPEEINAAVTTHGVEFNGITQRQESSGRVYEITPPNQQRPIVLNVRDLAYEYAALYLLTGKPEYAAKARDILLRFAEVIPSWPLYDRNNKPQSQSDQKYLTRSESNGIWSVWNPLDMAQSLPLLRAYDIIRPTLTPEENTRIVERIFVHQKELVDRCGQTKSYGNLAGYRLGPLILFGRVLGRPDYVHEAVTHMGELLRYSYTADGFWREVTPGYHRQITSRLIGLIPLVAKGHSDPEGYLYPGDGTRFDKLDLHERFELELGQLKRGLNVLAMPDGTYVSLNDSWPKKDIVEENVDKRSLDKPGLLGIAGVAKLGAKGMVAFLQFGGYRGHDQDAPLGLVWFAGKREVFSETGYQALPKSGSSREWNSIAASHNTAAVNEIVELRGKDRLTESLTVPFADTPEANGKPLTRVLPASATYANQGRLLLWSADSEIAQAMEAERERAYPEVTSLFRRTLVMVPDGEGDGYLIDIFRIRGGKTHDFFLRGGVDEPCTLQFDAPLKPATGTLYKYIELRESAEVRPPLLASMRYPDGYEVRSRLGGLFGTADATLQLLVGEAPAIRRLGKAPISMVRHRLAESQDSLESCYVWVHEAGRKGKIQSVRAETKGMDVTVVIDRGDRTDLVFSGENEHSRFEFDGWAFAGKLAFATKEGNQKPSGVVFKGESLKRGSALVAPAAPTLSGTVLSSARMEAGGESNSVLIGLDENMEIEGKQPRLVHIDFGEHIRFSIPVENAVREGNAIRLNLSHSPGFDITSGKAVMCNSPGWAYSGMPSVRIDCKTSSANE